MSKFRMLLFALVGILMSAMTAFAQAEVATGAADNASSVSKYRALAAGIGFGIAVIGGAIGQSRIGAAASPRRESSRSRHPLVRLFSLA